MYKTIRIRKALAGAMAAVMAVAASGGLALGVIAAVQADSESKVEDRNDLPIIMYHGLLKEEKRQGQFIISPNLFEQDLRYLQENGYTTVVIADLIAYVQDGKPLPEKPVMLTFDDGYYNNYLYAFPLLKQYNCKMVLSPIGRYTDEYTQNKDTHANYAHCSWDAVREMMASGLVEFQNHSYNLHSIDSGRKGAKKKAVESLVDYRTLLVEDVMKMQTRMREETGYTPTAFVYPFGAVSSESLPILKELGFQATLICESHINAITRDPECLYGLGRYRRPAKTGSEAFFKKILPKES